VKGVDKRMNPLELQGDDIEKVVLKYSNMIFKICLVLLCNEYDAKDAVQDTFFKYIRNTKRFENEEHEKAWLIRVAINICKNMLRFKFMHPQVDVDSIYDYYESEEEGEILEDLMTIPYKFKIVMILHYVEGYKVDEIAKIIGITPSAVKMRLLKGRKLLKQEYLKEDL
jgi:RNA polymerase sigma-70 factor (ECF subfamily)